MAGPLKWLAATTRSVYDDPCMKFWQLGMPNYTSDYQMSYVNGSLEHPYQLPFVDCEACGDRYLSDDTLSYECPPSLRKKFSDPEGVTMDEFNRLAEPVRKAVAKLRIKQSVVQPNASLLPAFLDVPSKPQADFLWPAMGLLVSERVRAALESLKIREIAFAEITLRKVGKKSAKLQPPAPSTGEPEDIIQEVSTTLFPKVSPKYFKLCVYGRSNPPPGRELKSVCSSCGNQDFNWARSKFLIMNESMWTGLDVFILETTSIVLVTDRVKQALQKLGPTNVEFREFPRSS